MKRRNFVRSLLVTPVAPAVLAAGQAATNTAPTQQPPPQPNTPARQMPRQPPEVPHLDVTAVDLTGQPAPQYFTAIQFSTLRKLGALLMPPLKNNPGAVEAQAPEFLDFLISVSPGDRQKLYLSGLDGLEASSKDKFHKSFCDLDAQQADTILKPLLVARPWPEDLPTDPLQNFLAQVHEDLRTATVNSREWTAASEKSGHHFTRRSRSSGYYWAPIDPIEG
ncbi:MAG: gluconate 2-dehydrogenase subunit 3 family protein [Acidobacteriota bacterium]|nr:gluconate 2-dehydrogenase subunit 3 family protein [Acidobacteriota bacterium]